MIVIVTGSRHWEDYNTLRSYMDSVSANEVDYKPFLIAHGAAKGADQLAEKYAKEKGISTIEFFAEWLLFGKKAGPIRNQKMVEWCLEEALDINIPLVCIAFPLPNSKGTWDCVRRCKRANIKTYVWGLDQ